MSSEYKTSRNMSAIASFGMAFLLLGTIFLFGGRLFREEEKKKPKEQILAEYALEDEKKKEEKKDDDTKEKVKEEVKAPEDAMEDLKDLVEANDVPMDDSPAALAPQSLSDMLSSMNGAGGGEMSTGMGGFNPNGVIGGTGTGLGGSKSADAGSGQLDEKPVLQNRVEPKIPKNLKARVKGGSFEIQIVVGKDGRVVKTEIVDSSVPEADSIIKEAVSKWKFKPGTRGGKSVPFKYKTKISFA